MKLCFEFIAWEKCMIFFSENICEDSSSLILKIRWYNAWIILFVTIAGNHFMKIDRQATFLKPDRLF